MFKRKIDSDRFRSLLLVSPTRALDILYRAYFDRLVNISFRYTKNRMISEDIVALTFVLFYDNRKKLAHEIKSIQHYLVRIIKNKSIDSYKHTMRTKNVLDHLRYQRVSSEQSAETTVMDNERMHELRNIILTFPQREKECLTMVMDEDMSLEQIAEILNISRKSVERGLTSGRKRLTAYRNKRNKL